MTHPRLEELEAKLQEARAIGGANQASPEQLSLLRAVARDCPTFTPNLLELARLLLLNEEAGVNADAAFAEIQRLLEQAVRGSKRNPVAVLELAHFLDTFRNAPREAEKLYEEGAAGALKLVEESWTALLDLWTGENTRESLVKALELAELAEKVFPESGDIMLAVVTARNYAARAGLMAAGDE
ncbi:hypothetical protein BO221_07635 [Archangium sp. Cb G35]|uniref:hypothetical protein n=1 Tax=Archangium sp. Cb G35 TaxID=1920190 RepID=UPI000937E4AA|nr:hypothetical protein [Archangium sp. Cb G35]OJT25720.1 hypothetical protein BO221_07635 [Archangium sp. Cb G35]